MSAHGKFQYSLAGLVWLMTILVANGAEDAQQKPLRYGFTKGQTYGYDVKITWNYPDRVETLKGFTLITVGYIRGDWINLTHEKNLVKLKPSQTPAPMESLSGVELPRSDISINHRGKVLDSCSTGSLNEIMKDEETIMLPMLPEGNKKQWHTDELIRIGKSRMGLPVISGNIQARDRTDYKWTRTEGDLAWIDFTQSISDRNRSYDSVTKKMDDPNFDLNANGRFAFDMRRGVVTTLSTTYKIASKFGAKNDIIRVKLECRLFEPAELAAIRKALSPKKADRTARKKALRALRSNDPKERMEGLELLRTFARDDRPEDFAVPLAKLLKLPVTYIRLEAAKALAVWATPEVEADLIAALSKAKDQEEVELIRALAIVGTEDAATAIVQKASDYHSTIGKALITIGPVAEKAAIELLKNPSHQAREAGCRALAKIGGADGAVALQQLLQKTRVPSSRELIFEALKSIKKRVSNDDIKAAAARKSKTLSDGMRTWTDVTGKFKTKAKLLGIQGRNVVLKKEDGKRITVPFDKLSRADQIYLRSALSAH